MNYRHCFLLLPLLFSCSTPEPVIPRELKGIEIVLPPRKTHYVSGETFCPSGMVILGNYNVGGNTPIYGYEAKPHRPLRPSDTSIAISYQGFSASLSIDVTGEDKDYEEEAWHYGSLGEDYLEHLAAQSGGDHYEVGQIDQPALDIHTDEQYAYPQRSKELL